MATHSGLDLTGHKSYDPKSILQANDDLMKSILSAPTFSLLDSLRSSNWIITFKEILASSVDKNEDYLQFKDECLKSFLNPEDLGLHWQFTLLAYWQIWLLSLRRWLSMPRWRLCRLEGLSESRPLRLKGIVPLLRLKLKRVLTEGKRWRLEGSGRPLVKSLKMPNQVLWGQELWRQTLGLSCILFLLFLFVNTLSLLP